MKVCFLKNESYSTTQRWASLREDAMKKLGPSSFYNQGYSLFKLTVLQLFCRASREATQNTFPTLFLLFLPLSSSFFSLPRPWHGYPVANFIRNADRAHWLAERKWRLQFCINAPALLCCKIFKMAAFNVPVFGVSVVSWTRNQVLSVSDRLKKSRNHVYRMLNSCFPESSSFFSSSTSRRSWASVSSSSHTTARETRLVWVLVIMNRPYHGFDW